ncbi:MAG: hypothetical protein LBI85_07480 [Spirochaetaceae bacterium]|jgi:hypothetical protein|nr:hypothetical protein [Spirochaetaceae bacterium]
MGARFRLLAAAFLCVSLSLAGEENTAMQGPRFIQRLGWTELESAAFYELTVERLDAASEYTRVLRKRSDKPFADCSLPPGQYRYQVCPYDFFGQAASPSAWGYFTVQSLTADRYAQRFTWTAVDFASFYEMVIERQSNGTYREAARIAGEENFVEISLPSGDYRSCVVSFDLLGRPGNASAWEYFTVLEPPRPPEETLKPVIASGKNAAVFAGLGFKPLFPLPFSEFNKNYGKGFQPAGASAWLVIMPFGTKEGGKQGVPGEFGFEFNPSWNYLSRETDGSRASNQLASVQANLLWRLRLGESGLALNFRLGGGLTLIWDLHVEYSGIVDKDRFTTWLGSASGGVSLQWAVTENLFVDIGAEYFQVFSVDNPFLNFIRPYAGLVRRLY